MILAVVVFVLTVQRKKSNNPTAPRRRTDMSLDRPRISTFEMGDIKNSSNFLIRRIVRNSDGTEEVIETASEGGFKPYAD